MEASCLDQFKRSSTSLRTLDDSRAWENGDAPAEVGETDLDVAIPKDGTSAYGAEEALLNAEVLTKARLPALSSAPRVGVRVRDATESGLLPPLHYKPEESNPTGHRSREDGDQKGDARARGGGGYALAGHWQSETAADMYPDDNPSVHEGEGSLDLPLASEDDGACMFVDCTSHELNGTRIRTTKWRTAALAVMAVSQIKHYRRSSATLHGDLLRAFVPDILIHYLDNASKPLESQAFFTKAACMCADISGFTALSEKHCKQGTVGLDALVQIINSYYSNLVNIVYSFGGDIIKIAGDALYCVFMPDSDDLRGALLCAALCSMQLREVAADGLTLHVGISCGELCFGILGGIDNYWECLMSGNPIGLVADALDEAKKQEVVISSECLPIMGDCCVGTPLPSRNVLLRTVDPPRREKRGSVRVATMIANKGLPVELEPTEGLFAGGSMQDLGSQALETLAATAAEASRRFSGMPEMRRKDDRQGDEVSRESGGSSKGKEDPAREMLVTGIGAKKLKIALGAAGKMRADSTPEVFPLLGGFVPGPVTDMLAAGIFMYMAEMRTVTTLFVKLDGYSPDKHRNLLSLQIYLTSIQKILAEHEGFLRQFLVDDKGCVLIACWGVPGRSYPDNGNRCLAAAVEMHAGLGALDMKTSMGVTTGHALCGRVGGKIRSEYAMVGDVINLAARLMGKAKGRIVCDEVTHDLVCGNDSLVVLFKRLDPMMLKGKEKPISPYVCLAQQGTDMWNTHKQLRMIGRTELQNSINAFLDSLGKAEPDQIPQPVVVVIEGAHGTGKTMVADRIKKSAAQFFRRKVYMYSMAQASANIPYSGAQGMLRTIFGLDHLGDDALAIKQVLLKMIQDVYGEEEATTTTVATAALKTVLGVDIEADTEDQILHMRPSYIKGRLPLHAVHSVISELTTHAMGIEPIVFVLDNVQLMDEMSWKLLIQLLQCPLPVLMVLTATSVEEEIRKRKDLSRAKKRGQPANVTSSKDQEGQNLTWQREHGETHFHMQQYIRATQLPITTKFTLLPFSREELIQLLQHTLVPKDNTTISDTLVDAVYSLCGGNPYWCVEVVRFIKENSVETFMSRMSVKGERASGGAGGSTHRGGAEGPLQEDAIMGRMGILVVCRFERLLVEEQSVVRYASVAGLEFSMKMLSRVLPRNIRPQLDLIIRALVTARFVVHSRHTYYKFRNPMVHMVLYNLTPASSRKRMHKAVADYYITYHLDDPLYLPVVTHHLLRAQVSSRLAVEFLCKTAAHALILFCYEDCLEALEKAVGLVSSVSEIHEVMVVQQYIEAMHQLGHTEEKFKDPREGGSDSAMRAEQSESKPEALEAEADEAFVASDKTSIGADSSASKGPEAFTPEELAQHPATVQSTAHEPSFPGSVSTRLDHLQALTESAHMELCPADESCFFLHEMANDMGRKAVDNLTAQPAEDVRGELPKTGAKCTEPSKIQNTSTSVSNADHDIDDGTQDTRQDGRPWDGRSSARSAYSGEAGDGVDIEMNSSRDARGSAASFPRNCAGASNLLPASLCCELARILDECLGHFIEPGAVRPEYLKRVRVTFSTSDARLPSESGAAASEPYRAVGQEEKDTMRGVQEKAQDDPRAPRIGALRSKVSSAKMLLTERTASMKLARGASSGGFTVTYGIKQSLGGAGRLASKIRLLSPEASYRSTCSARSRRSKSPSRSNDVVVGKVVLAPLGVPRIMGRRHSGQRKVISNEGPSGRSHNASDTSEADVEDTSRRKIGVVEGRTQEGRSRICVVS